MYIVIPIIIIIRIITPPPLHFFASRNFTRM